ncbi:hypothetical protein GUJ93_ZPchr0002g26423 [Zizania palustris]|uniref:Uncharacterized protein n=1 Tax=Zizania palustris TaxID=103762 RepID=A0A8J5VR28_ZIZPA|nr:hypothetical protein GUJ93_ZPchr0002g26423 [Zizania palustris]
MRPSGSEFDKDRVGGAHHRCGVYGVVKHNTSMVDKGVPRKISISSRFKRACWTSVGRRRRRRQVKKNRSALGLPLPPPARAGFDAAPGASSSSSFPCTLFIPFYPPPKCLSHTRTSGTWLRQIPPLYWFRFGAELSLLICPSWRFGSRY